jgi:CHASE2 domain-containing sensor protein
MTAWRRLKAWALLRHPHSLPDELNPFGGNWRRAIRFWAVLVGLLFAGNWLSHLWVFEYAGLWSGDALLRLRPPRDASHTGLVVVTREERARLLGGASPIPPRKLMQALCAVLRVHPKVLGVDLATDEVPLSDLPKAPVVWARGIRIDRVGESIRVEQEAVLGGKHPAALNGLAVAPVMPDWSVRQIHFCYEYDKRRVMQTMTGALVMAAGSPVGLGCDRDEYAETGAYDVNYRFQRFTLSEFSPEKIDDAALAQCVAGTGDWDAGSKGHPLRGRVVVLGGEYEAQDWHPTPFGLRPGAEVLAGLAEHVLSGASATDSLGWQKWGVKLLLALVIAWIHCRLRPVAALLVCVLGLAALVLCGGFIAVFLAGYRASTVPLLVGVILEQLVTSAEKAQEVEHG